MLSSQGSCFEEVTWCRANVHLPLHSSWDRSSRLTRLVARLQSAGILGQRGLRAGPWGQAGTLEPQAQVSTPLQLCLTPGACPAGELTWLLQCSATSTS